MAKKFQIDEMVFAEKDLDDNMIVMMGRHNFLNNQSKHYKFSKEVIAYVSKKHFEIQVRKTEVINS